MDENPDADEGEPRAAGLRGQFPGYFPPDDEELKVFITTGLVAFDTNALFDLYRFNDQARQEYLASMRLLGDRLWIPNRVGEEFLTGRLEVIRECSNATAKLSDDLKGSFDVIHQQIRTFGNRRGLSPEKILNLESMIDGAFVELSKAAAQSFVFKLDVDSSLRSDPILREIESVLDGKVGPPFVNAEEEEAEGHRRIESKTPPGYADAKKDAKKAVGDYLAWRQLVNEASQRKLPILLVSNDQKEDWIREYQGRIIGPRSELVAEMLSLSGQKFHLFRVKSFLLHAQKHLGADVSESTVEQAERLDMAEHVEWVGRLVIAWVLLESVLSDYVRLFARVPSRPRSSLELIRHYAQLEELSPEEVEELNYARAARNRAVHAPPDSPIGYEDLETMLDTIGRHTLRARRRIDDSQRPITVR